MNKTERIQAAIKGNEVDSLPYGFWTHLPGLDLDPVKLADATYEFYNKYDIDFVKTMNNGMYPVESWGCEADFSGILNGGVAKLVSTPINCLEDWKKIQPVDIGAGSHARELTSLGLLLKKINQEAPILFTVFSPLTIADKLSNNKVIEHIRQGGGELIHQALAAITQTTAKLAARAVDMGAAGVFFASQMSCYDIIPDSVYGEYGKKYDVAVLEAAGAGWFNTIHAHGNNIIFQLLRDYPVDVFNWHAWETLPGIEEARDMTGKCLMGGLKRGDITAGNKNEISAQIYHCVKLLMKKKHILTPGCVMRYPLDEAMLMYVKETKDIVEKTLKENGE
ncbi:MAG TPA: uroporphyrinogen decarboxylase family protein [Patescibacteria group bacterium]|nr:uroporphyrinogen decarboxylase family protein [Patescibacteria group bacterium]